MTKSEAAKLNGKKGGRPRKSVTPVETPVAALPLDTPQTVVAPAVATLVDNPHNLSPRELLFVEAYCGVANFNASEAYRLAGFEGKPASISANAARLIGSDRVSKAVAAKFTARIHALRVMDGDEALERLTYYARADIGKVLAADDPIAQLPDDIRLCIKTVRPGKFGRTIELYDSMKATELMAKSAGKLKEIHVVEHTLEEVLALSNAQHQEVA